MTEPVKRRRGFAAMDPAMQRRLAASGGQAVAAEKRAFARNPELAREAGRKGGMAKRANREAGE